MTDVDLALRLFLQLVVIIGTCRLVGWLGRRFLGQTQVVMEMIAGVVLGPSLFGMLWPGGQSWLFPQTTPVLGADGIPVIGAHGEALTMRHPSMQILYVMSQVGLVLYMFIVGLELNTDLIKKHAKSASMVSLSGILGPFALGVLATPLLFSKGHAYESGVTFPVAALFTGAAMCITAFPMLARIIYEKGISQTKLGTLSLAAGATGDVIAWVVLAVVLAVLKSNARIAAYAVVGGVLFAVFMFTFGKRLFAWMGRRMEQAGKMTPTLFAGTLLLLMAAAAYTDSIGIYAVFGAFLVGVSVPQGKYSQALQEKVEGLTVSLLLPLFFVYSGLNTRLGLLDSPELWLITAVVIGAAVAGKAIACTLAAKASGQTWRESWLIGTLMNARGLMELIIINIGLQAHLITPTLYTMLVLMAIVTTVMASPIFELLYRRLESSLKEEQKAGIVVGAELVPELALVDA